MALTGITLRIYGGSQANGLNLTPLVSVGNMHESYKPMPPTIVDEDISWGIIHGQSFTAYTLHTKQFKTKDGQPGQLLISILLPPAQCFAKGKDPLTMLNSILVAFTVHPQVCGLLPESPLDSSSFNMLVKGYSLMERPRLLPLMRGVEPAAFRPQNEAQLSALMRYSNYPVLAKVARLELGMHTPSTIQIPMSGGAPQKQEPQKQESPKQEPQKQEPAQKTTFASLGRENKPYQEPPVQSNPKGKETRKQEVLDDDWIPNKTKDKPKETSEKLNDDWIPTLGGEGGEEIGNGGGNGKKLLKYLAIALVLLGLIGVFSLLNNNDNGDSPKPEPVVVNNNDEGRKSENGKVKSSDGENVVAEDAGNYNDKDIKKVVIFLKEAIKMHYYALADKGNNKYEIVRVVNNFTPADDQVDVAVSPNREMNLRNKVDAILSKISGKYTKTEILFIAQKNLQADPDFKVIDDYIANKPKTKKIIYYDPAKYAGEDREIVQKFIENYVKQQ